MPWGTKFNWKEAFSEGVCLVRTESKKKFPVTLNAYGFASESLYRLRMDVHALTDLVKATRRSIYVPEVIVLVLTVLPSAFL